MRTIWRERVTTVFVRQGHHALDRKRVASSPAAGIGIVRIGDQLSRFRSEFARMAKSRARGYQAQPHQQ